MVYCSVNSDFMMDLTCFILRGWERPSAGASRSNARPAVSVRRAVLRAARSEGLHVQAGIGTAPGIVGRQHGGRIHREGFVASRRGRERLCRPLFPRGRNHPARPAGGFLLGRFLGASLQTTHISHKQSCKST